MAGGLLPWQQTVSAASNLGYLRIITVVVVMGVVCLSATPIARLTVKGWCFCDISAPTLMLNSKA
jgi:hypothetical protein